MTGRPPFWVIGAPRSGTTFLSRVLDAHPRIVCTDETRVMSFVNRILNGLAADRWILMRERERFLDLLRDALADTVASLYADLGAGPDDRWGDKHPHYADPYHDPELLDLIDEIFPGSQFVHIIRDGRAVVSSNLAKGWGTLDYASDSWRRHVVHARDFGTALGPERYLELRYEELVDEPAPVVAALVSFLGVGPAPQVDELLAEQERARTSWSGPTAGTVASDSWRDRYEPADLDRVERNLANLLVELGYETQAWRRSLLCSPPAADVPPRRWTPAGHARRAARNLSAPAGTGRP